MCAYRIVRMSSTFCMRTINAHTELYARLKLLKRACRAPFLYAHMVSGIKIQRRFATASTTRAERQQTMALLKHTMPSGKPIKESDWHVKCPEVRITNGLLNHGWVLSTLPQGRPIG
jgi:hypothetical protein